jgi:hypothetical protein
MSKNSFRNFILDVKANIRAYGSGCGGCQAVKKDVMITFGSKIHVLDGNNKVVATEDNQHVDVFMDKQQARNFYKELGKLLEEIEKEEVKDLLKINK